MQGVGCVMQGWGVSCRGGVGWVMQGCIGVDVSCIGAVSHVGMGWGEVGHVGVWWGQSCRGGVGHVGVRAMSCPRHGGGGIGVPFQ